MSVPPRTLSIGSPTGASEQHESVGYLKKTTGLSVNSQNKTYSGAWLSDRFEEGTASRTNILSNTVDNQNATKYSLEPFAVESLLPFAEEIRDIFSSPSLATGKGCYTSSTREGTNASEHDRYTSCSHDSDTLLETKEGELRNIDECRSSMGLATASRRGTSPSHDHASSPVLSSSKINDISQTCSKRKCYSSDSSIACLQRGVTRDQASRWSCRYEELKQFKIKKGHCGVPSRWPQNLALSKWVKHQRYQWKLFKSGKRSTLSLERIRSLDSLGFAWEPHNVSWEGHLRQLVAFQIEHGHSNVPARHENRSLANWVKHQRRQFKILCRRGCIASNLTFERVLKLVNIDFVFDPAVWNLNSQSPNPLPTWALVASMIQESDIHMKFLEARESLRAPSKRHLEDFRLQLRV